MNEKETKLTVRVEPDFKERVEKAAKKEQQTTSAFVKKAVVDAVKKTEKE